VSFLSLWGFEQQFKSACL